MAGRVLANEAWEALLSAHAVLVKELAAQGIWRDISMREYDVLYTLAKRGEPVRLGELHRRVLLSQPALSRLVDRLVEQGLVARRADPVDGRGVRLVLTDEGRSRQRELGRRHARDVARAMHARVSPDELAQLAVICRKLAGDGENDQPGGGKNDQPGDGKNDQPGGGENNQPDGGGNNQRGDAAGSGERRSRPRPRATEATSRKADVPA